MSSAQPIADPIQPRIPQWNLSDRMRKARESADMEQKEVAELIGVSHQAISTWENGRRNPSSKSVTKFAKVVNVDIRWLLGFDVPEDVDSTGNIRPRKLVTRRTSNGTPLRLLVA